MDVLDLLVVAVPPWLSLTEEFAAHNRCPAIASLDGYVADEGGKFDWAEPDEEMHAFVNELERPVGTYLYGRRMYEVMVA